MRRSLTGAITGLAVLGALAGCSHPRSSQTASTLTPSPTDGSAYVNAPSSTAPSGPATTQAGTSLKFGSEAVVRWQARADNSALLDITVTSAQKSSFSDKAWRGWKVASKTRQSTPYFVHATIKDSGTTRLDGLTAPLYALDDGQQLLQPSTFKVAFPACNPPTFPVHFKPGQSTKVCLVYLVPAGKSFVGVSYRPDDTQPPITWSTSGKG